MKHLLYIAISIIIFVSITGCSWIVPEPHSLKFNRETFDPLAEDIINQQSIFEMDDFTRYYSSINNVRIRFEKEPADSLDNTLFYDNVIDSLKIQRTLVEDLRTRLQKTNLRQFYKSNDSIVFIVDGFLSDSWGYFYSKKPLNNDTTEFYFGQHQIHYIESINEHWKKAAMH